MTRYVRYVTIVVLVAIVAMTSMAAFAQGPSSFSRGELDDLLGPIALYPDPLIAQILPAATYPDELDRADNLVQLRGGRAIIDSQDWDVSVKAVAHYPSILRMMADQPDWTTALGQAYVDQPDDVMNSIQRLRSKARLLGHLKSNSHQQVIVEDGYISIVPVSGQYVYVPKYDSSVVYVQRYRNDNHDLVVFTAGLLIGAWLNRDVDWHHHHVYYHGWRGRGWIGHSRPFVHIDNHYYVRNEWYRRPIDVDRRVRERDIRHYRDQMRSHPGDFRLPDSNHYRYDRDNQNGYRRPSPNHRDDRRIEAKPKPSWKPAPSTPVNNRPDFNRKPQSWDRTTTTKKDDRRPDFRGNRPSIDRTPRPATNDNWRNDRRTSPATDSRWTAQRTGSDRGRQDTDHRSQVSNRRDRASSYRAPEVRSNDQRDEGKDRSRGDDKSDKGRHRSDSKDSGDSKDAERDHGRGNFRR